MRYLELSLAVRPDAVEAAADLLRRHAPAGVSIEPSFDATDEDGGVALDGAAATILRAWLPDGERERLAELRRELRALGDAVMRPLRARAVADTTWADAWKQHFRVLRVGRRLVVRPAWRRHRPRRDDVVIELDPGAAFGTGQHATTRLCLEALEERMTEGATVLDLGSGSGILAVAAALLGASTVDAVDIDPTAVRATAETAQRNGMADRVRVAQGSLGDAWPFDEPPERRYDLLLANLNARAVRELARPLVGALRPEGVALVSGVIEEHEASCRDALAAAGGRAVEARARDGWVLLTVEAQP